MITLDVNGRPHATDAPPATPLLFVLRDECGLTAAKFGCGAGQCGACTVHVGGRAVQSCDAPLWSVDGAQVTTLEGLAPPGGPLHAVQEAFRRHGAIQCGFCIPGILMTLVALKAREPGCGIDRVRQELAERHLCRCGTHTRILAAARDYLEAP